MIYCNLLKFSFIWILTIKFSCVVFSLTSFGILKYDCVIRIIEMLNFLPLINNSVTAGFSFMLLIISEILSSKTINTLRFFILRFLRILQYFYKHLAYHSSIQ